MDKNKFIEEKLSELIQEFGQLQRNPDGTVKKERYLGEYKISFLRQSLEVAWRKGELEILHSEGLAEDEE